MCNGMVLIEKINPSTHTHKKKKNEKIKIICLTLDSTFYTM